MLKYVFEQALSQGIFLEKKLTKLIFIFKANDGTFVTKRDLKPFTLSFLKEKLLKVDWGLLYTIKDLIEAYETF